MADYSSDTEMQNLAGQVAVDLRTDDAVTATLLQAAIDYAGGEVEFYCQGRFSLLDTVQYARNAATAFALEWLCMRRFNAVVEPLTKMCDRYREQLTKVAEGKFTIPGAARSRRQVTVTNQVVDLRRFNNQVRTDRSRSTGVAKGYVRPVDYNAPDER
ncbi:: DUF1320 [Gemmataceae bacterium]|nr:: DUF1320 [Gemmataceae bacterium]VTT96560.1 : DUF1320 [Gemmataceae bacterium]